MYGNAASQRLADLLFDLLKRIRGVKGRPGV